MVELLLFAQPNADEPIISFKKLKRGEIIEAKGSNELWLTDIGWATWQASNYIDSNAKISLIKRIFQDKWDINISFSKLKIMIRSRAYQGLVGGYLNNVISLKFVGDIEDVTNFINVFINKLNRKPYNMFNWNNFSKKTGIAKKELVTLWETLIKKGEGEEDLEEELEEEEENKEVRQPSHLPQPPEIAIKRGYSLTGDMFKFGVKVENNSNNKIYDVDVKLRVPEALTLINPKSSMFRIRSIDPNASETAIFLMRPIRCVSGFIKGTVEYEDPISNKILTIEMNQKEIQSICPFVEPDAISETDYIRFATELTEANNFVQTGYSFAGTTIDTVSNILFEKCSNMALVSERDLGTEKLLFFSGKSTVEKIRYLLTTAIREEESMIHIAFKGYSNRKEGLVGFLSEITDCVRYSIAALKTTREVTKIEMHNVQNIIDSVLVRSKVEM